MRKPEEERKEKRGEDRKEGGEKREVRRREDKSRGEGKVGNQERRKQAGGVMSRVLFSLTHDARPKGCGHITRCKNCIRYRLDLN